MPLFQSLTDPKSAAAASLLVEAIGADDYPRVRSMLQSIERGETHVPLPNISPDVGAFYSASYVIIVCSGTENAKQMVGNFIGIEQRAQPPIPGKMHSVFADQAKLVHDQIDGAVAPLLPTRTLVLCGHSRGGAVAQILAAWWGPSALACRCYTFGSPRVGDVDFAAAAGPYVIRYENLYDTVTIIPFNQSPGPYAPWYQRWFGPLGGQVWAEAGEQRTLYADGSTIPDGPRPGQLALYDQMLRQDFNTHNMLGYRRSLSVGNPDPFTADQVADPPQFNAEANSLAAADSSTVNALFAQGSFMPSPLVAGSFFFKTIDRTFGWTESWYATISVEAMIDALRNLTVARLAFLSPGCVIYWYRASVVELGAPRASVIFKRNTPAKGTARPGGTVAADYPGSTMDCIVATLLSSQGSKRQEKFRGLPDAWIEDDALSTSGSGALDIINSYLVAVKAAGLGIRRGTTAPADKKAITGWTKAANGNVQLSVPLHGYLDTQPFQALIRGRTLANPMVRGTWTISVVDANTVELVPSTRFGIGTGAPGGTVTKSAYGADSMIVAPGLTRLFQFNQVSTIKTGRPSDLHHGKKSAVVRHR